MVKALKLGVCTPALYAVDEVQRSITMQEVQGVSVKDFLLSQAAHGPGKLLLGSGLSLLFLSLVRIHMKTLFSGITITSQ